MQPMKWVTLGCWMGALSVALGAIAAHGIDGLLVKTYADAEPRTIVGQEIPRGLKALDDFKTAARYQMYHGLALIGLGIVCQTRTAKTLQWAGYCFLLGIILSTILWKLKRDVI